VFQRGYIVGVACPYPEGMAAVFNAIGITVADMAKTLTFYRLLGLEFEEADLAEGHVEWEGPGGLRIMFDTLAVVHSFDPDWQPPVGGPAMSLAFECGTPAEVDEAVAQVVQAGFDVHREPWDAFWGQRYATVLDPDGNRVDLFAWA
jgi:catechol 2,3-dioxygenase-like lactoylglutathione lyase family enzyme